MTPLLLLLATASPAEDVLVGAVEAAIAGDARAARRGFERAARLLPEQQTLVSSARGLSNVLNRRRASARALLADLPVYQAMAQVREGAGGIGRARETLAKAASNHPGPGADFLAALAFYSAGRTSRAHALLARSVSASDSALSEAFAPDPAVGLVRVAFGAKLSSAGRKRLAKALLDAGRRGEAIRIATREGANELLADAWAPVDPRRALRYAEKLNDPARTAALKLALGKTKEARAMLGELRDETAAVLRIKTRLLLEEDPAQALVLAQESARLEPKSDQAPYLVAEALLANEKLDRAHAFAEELLRRRPSDIDPFDLLRRIEKAQGQQQQLRALELRSHAHDAERRKRDEARRRREAVIAAVREAEAGLGTTGLEAVRAADPTFSLVVDLALARMGRPGTARAARERILAACADDLRKLLSPEGPWERVLVEVSPYGHVQKASVPLSAPDPGRCGGRVLRK